MIDDVCIPCEYCGGRGGHFRSCCRPRVPMHGFDGDEDSDAEPKFEDYAPDDRETAPSIKCPACGEVVLEVASATLSLALSQHWNFACSNRVPLEERLRHAWETGFRLAVAYGDNYAHWDGEQRERQWQYFLSAHPAAAPSPIPTPPLISQEVLDGLTVAGARAFWALKDLEKQYESLRVDVMTVVSDPHLTWEQARQALRDALK